MIKHGIVIVLVASTISCESPSGQKIPDEVTCSDCLVSAHVISTVGALDGPGMLEREPLAMSRDAQGRYVLYAGGGLPQVFGPDGAHVSDLGRPGDGPGELRGGLPIPVGGDSILVLASRATLFGPDFSYSRQITVPTAFRGAVVLRWPDSVVVRGDIQKGEKAGLPLHTMSFAGAEAIVLTSGGSTSGDQSDESNRVKLASQGPGQVWTFHSPYVLRKWDSNLRVAQTLERKPGWWRDPETGLPYGIPHRSPPSSSVAAVALDSVGLIWVFIHVAAPNWREGWADVPPGASEIPAKLIRRELLFNSIVEVIDPRTMRVVTRSQLPHYVLQAFNDRTVAVYAPTPEGAPRADILQLTLSGLAGLTPSPTADSTPDLSTGRGG